MKSTNTAWAKQADLSKLVGGDDYRNGRWDADTLAFYNRPLRDAWMMAQSE